MRKSPRKCQVFLCTRLTRSKKAEPLEERYCRFHHPENIAKLKAASEKARVTPRKKSRLSHLERSRRHGHADNFTRLVAEATALAERVESAGAAELLRSNVRGEAPPALPA